MADDSNNVVAKKDKTALAARRSAAAAHLRTVIQSVNTSAVTTPVPSSVPSSEPRSRMPAMRWVEQAIQLRPADFQKSRRNMFFLRFGAFVILPTLLMAFYVYVYATPRYVSELQISYQSNQPTSTASSSAGLLSSIMGGASTGTLDMSQVLQTFLTSNAAAEAVDKDVHFREHYSSSKIDWWDRLSPTASTEKFVAYFNRRISITRQLGGYVTVDVEAFSPEFARKVGNSLSNAANLMVARMMDTSHNDAVSLAEKELKRTEDRLRQTTVAMTKFRNLHSDVNIQGTATSLDTVVSGLESQVSQTTSDLADAKSFLSDSAPSVVALNARLTALKSQIASEKAKLGYLDSGKTPSGKLPYSQIVAEYAALQTEQKFATDSYVSAKSALDIARAMAAQKAGYILNFVPPGLPQASTAPDPFFYIASAFMVALFVYINGTLMIGIFHDRAGA